jgi:hypothetical protein
MLIPEERSNTVFNNGKPNGLTTCIPTGGQTQPIQIEGDILYEKKAQKKLKKNIISEIINKIIPVNIFF